MKKQIIVVFLCLCTAMQAQTQQKISAQEVAVSVMNKGFNNCDITLYQGSLFLQGMSELALATSSEEILDQTVGILEKFGTREIKGTGSFYSYHEGGNGAALLSYRKAAPSLTKQVLAGARRMMKEHRRSEEGIMVPSWISQEKDQVFIDMAFAVSPYLLYAGLIDNNPEYIDFAVFETLELFRVLKDSQSGLLHQGRGFVVKGKTSEDNWSRGNGWGALAMASLLRDLPKKHPQRKEVEREAKEYFMNLLKYQDENGLWHQEITVPTSYTELTGSGLLLYALGVAIESGVVNKKYRANFEKGLSSLTAYIAEDGSVSNGCGSCLCPGKGTKEDYIRHPWYYNESHVFGPILLAFAQGINMGITEIPIENKMGYLIGVNTQPQAPRTYVKYVPRRSGDIAWENNRIAFRVYSQTVKDKVSSGVDIWTKSVEHPVVDHWYDLNAKKLDYHTDRGEGYDFYNLGFTRGCGGTAVWKDGKLFPAETFANYRIYKNEKEEIIFELSYLPYQVNGVTVYEKKRIRMLMDTNFFRVESLFETENGEDLTVAIGVSTFGNPRFMHDQATGRMAASEQISKKDGMIGTAVYIDPAQLEQILPTEKECLALVKVRSGKPFVYYAGAAWNGNPRFASFDRWNDMIKTESWKSLNDFYLSK